MKIGKTYIEFISEKKSKKKSPAAQIKKLTKKQKDSLHRKAMDAGKVIYSEKFKVEVDPQDGVLQRMKNPNYKK